MPGSFRDDLFVGKTVLIIGGSTGIGAGIARTFRAHGARVIVTGSTAAKLDWCSAEGIEGHAADVRSDADCASILGGLDRLDVLVTAAGILRRDDEHQLDVFQEVLDVNLVGTARYAFGARDLLAASRGVIITIASMLSYFGDRRVPAYAASKGGVSQLTKSLALAFAPDRIRVNAIAPGWIKTPLTEELWQSPSIGSAIASRTATKTWGAPNDIANGALFLASPAAAYVTGTTLVIDGGYSIS